jgi:hypothetical protein
MLISEYLQTLQSTDLATRGKHARRTNKDIIGAVYLHPSLLTVLQAKDLGLHRAHMPPLATWIPAEILVLVSSPPAFAVNLCYDRFVHHTESTGLLALLL